MKVYVPGLGGNQADLFEIFTSIDGSLLIATLVIVIVILLVVYRSPILWVLPLVTVGVGFVLAGGVVSKLASAGIIDVDGQSRGVLPALVFGAVTDTALAIIPRYGEGLPRCPGPSERLRAALRGAGGRWSAVLVMRESWWGAVFPIERAILVVCASARRGSACKPPRSIATSTSSTGWFVGMLPNTALAARKAGMICSRNVAWDTTTEFGT